MEHFCNMYKNPLSLYLWSKNIILQLYEISHSMWIHRNNIVHEDFEEKLNRKESEKLKKAMTDEYRKGHSNIMSQIIPKKKWLLTIQASRICFEKIFSGNTDAQSIILDHAFVPD